MLITFLFLNIFTSDLFCSDRIIFLYRLWEWWLLTWVFKKCVKVPTVYAGKSEILFVFGELSINLYDGHTFPRIWSFIQKTLINNQYIICWSRFFFRLRPKSVYQWRSLPFYPPPLVLRLGKNKGGIKW